MLNKRAAYVSREVRSIPRSSCRTSTLTFIRWRSIWNKCSISQLTEVYNANTLYRRVQISFPSAHLATTIDPSRRCKTAKNGPDPFVPLIQGTLYRISIKYRPHSSSFLARTRPHLKRTYGWNIKTTCISTQPCSFGLLLLIPRSWLSFHLNYVIPWV